MENAWQLVCALLPPRDLSRCERVSKEWRNRVNTMQLRWKHIDFSTDFEKAGTSEELIAGILERCGDSLLSLRFGQRGSGRFAEFPSKIHLNRRHMDSVTIQRRLRTLVVHRMILTLSALEELQFINKDLEEFELSSCRMDVYSSSANELVQNSMVEMLRKCTKLKKFKITGRQTWNDHFAIDKRILDALPKSLRVLDLSVGCALTLEDLQFLNGMMLDSLTLQWMSIKTSPLNVLLSMSESLSELNLSYMNRVTDFSVIGKLRKLRKLTLDGNRTLSDDCLISITHGCPELRKLSLEYCVATSYRSLSTIGLLYELELLNVRGLLAVRRDVIEHVANCVHLETVDVSHCRNISSDALFSLVHLPSLNHLICYGVPAMSSSFLSKCACIPRILERDPDIVPKIPLTALVLPSVPPPPVLVGLIQ